MGNSEEQILYYVPRRDLLVKTDDIAEDRETKEKLMDYEKMKKSLRPFAREDNLTNFKTENCLVCQNKEYVDYDYGIPLCQTCLYRRNLFLYGSNLQCNICEIRLTDDNFEGCLGESWCKRCLNLKFRKVAATDEKLPGLKRPILV